MERIRWQSRSQGKTEIIDSGDYGDDKYNDDDNDDDDDGDSKYKVI